MTDPIRFKDEVGAELGDLLRQAPAPPPMTDAALASSAKAVALLAQGGAAATAAAGAGTAKAAGTAASTAKAATVGAGATVAAGTATTSAALFGSGAAKLAAVVLVTGLSAGAYLDVRKEPRAPAQEQAQTLADESTSKTTTDTVRQTTVKPNSPPVSSPVIDEDSPDSVIEKPAETKEASSQRPASQGVRRLGKGKVDTRPATQANEPDAAAEEETQSADALAAEVALLDQARSQLSSAPAEALATAKRHAQDHPRGQLGTERELITIDALGRLGRVGEAETRGRALIARSRGSIYARRAQTLLRRFGVPLEED